MANTVSLWLHETPLGEALLTMVISMLPVVELRGGLPAGVELHALKLHETAASYAEWYADDNADRL